MFLEGFVVVIGKEWVFFLVEVRIIYEGGFVLNGVWDLNFNIVGVIVGVLG